jgi:transcriptional regulator with XRE-family HTH domain
MDSLSIFIQMTMNRYTFGMKINKIWFDSEHIYVEADDNKTLSQSLLWYPHLKNATDEERLNYSIGLDGIHWRNINENVSFESFEYKNNEPTGLSKFFLSHREINASAIARRVGISPNMMAQYISGNKVPSKERELTIMRAVMDMGKEIMQAAQLAYSSKI